MRNAAAYIDAIREKKNLHSDYAAAKALGITRQAVSKYRLNADHFGPEMAEKVALILDIDVEQVMLDSALSRAKTDSERKAWEKIATCFSAFAKRGAGTTGNDASLPSRHISKGEKTGLCIM